MKTRSSSTLGSRAEAREADGLTSVVKHFGPRFAEFWTREGRGLVAPKAEGFEWLIADDEDNSVFAWLRMAPGEAPVAVKLVS